MDLAPEEEIPAPDLASSAPETTSTEAPLTLDSQPQSEALVDSGESPPQVEVLEERAAIETLAYGRMLAAAIGGEQRYPRAARRMGAQGIALVHVRISPGGEMVGAPRIAESTGNGLLDREALRMVRAAAPFPRLPPEIGERTAEFPVPIRFELR